MADVYHLKYCKTNVITQRRYMGMCDRFRHIRGLFPVWPSTIENDPKTRLLSSNYVVGRIRYPCIHVTVVIPNT